MRLSNKDAKEYYEICFKLFHAVNEKHQLNPSFATFAHGEVPSEEASIIRDYIWDHPESIDEVIANNENVGYNDRELAVLETWRNRYIYSDFVIVEHRSNHTVFMDTKNDMRLYAVQGIYESLKKVFPPRIIPVLLIKTVLLPFKNKIIIDGSLNMAHPEDIEELTDEFLKSYREAKKKWGTTFTLPHRE